MSLPHTGHSVQLQKQVLFVECRVLAAFLLLSSIYIDAPKGTIAADP